MKVLLFPWFSAPSAIVTGSCNLFASLISLKKSCSFVHHNWSSFPSLSKCPWERMETKQAPHTAAQRVQQEGNPGWVSASVLAELLKKERHSVYMPLGKYLWIECPIQLDFLQYCFVNFLFVFVFLEYPTQDMLCCLFLC